MKHPEPPRLDRLLDDLSDDLLDPDAPLELAEEELRRHGLDPAEVARESQQHARAELSRLRLSWQGAARARLAQARAALAGAGAAGKRTRDELLRALADAGRDPRFAGQLAVAFRKRSAEEASDEELATLVEELEALARLSDLDGLEPPR